MKLFSLSLILFSTSAFAGPAQLAEALTKNHALLTRMGTPDLQDEKAKNELKLTVGRQLKTDGSKLTVLTNPDNKSAWFGGIVIFVEPSGKAYFVDKTGKFFTEHLKDRVIGGTLSRDASGSALLTLFYGAPGSPEFYTAYLGTTKLKVIQFNLDRETGNIEGNVKLPTGRVLKITRIGRDNAAVKVNNLPLNPLFL